ncbi:MAG: apolipoprotein N-acyltransferase [Treponema sp.]|nr:apolipoprotein N-acyltransferase [Treponema sp.]
MKNKKESKHNKLSLKSILVDSALLLTGVLFFILSNPNFIFSKGLGILSWFAYIPVFLLVSRCSIKSVWGYGALYGGLSYCGYVYWLTNYSPAGLIAIVAYFAVLYSLLFICLKAGDLICGKNGWIIQWLILTGFDYLRTLGFVGFNYGILAYTQWQFIHLIQICNVIGIFGLNSILIFCSAIFYNFIQRIVDRKETVLKFESNHTLYENKSHISYVNNFESAMKMTSQKDNLIALAVIVVVLCGSLIYGFVSVKESVDEPFITVGAVQHNENPKDNGIEVYRQNAEELMRITTEMLYKEPSVELVVWPETAIVPAIVYQFNTHRDEGRYGLVSSVLEYVKDRKPAFVIGNGHIVVNKSKTAKINYNSALFFNDKNKLFPPEPEIYSKNHLVPFTEYFPYEKNFPELYKILSANNMMWTPGNNLEVFECNSLKFSTPICFEDTFPDICRKMYKKGARAFVNLSNDAWSESEACQYQHLSMAVFRSAENKIPSVRSTTSGQTCIINQYGKVIEEAKPFEKTYVTGKLQIVREDRKPTVYNVTGDVFPIAAIISAVLMLIIHSIQCIIKKSTKNGK